MDAFSLALSYGIKSISKKNVIITAITVGLFHFFMPLLGNMVGISLFENTFIKPKYVLFIVFLLLSVDMLLNVFGTLFFAISVSLDSFSVGIGINYLYDNILFVVSSFCIISALFTFLGFYLGRKINNKIGKYSFLLGSITLFIYSLLVLTK